MAKGISSCDVSSVLFRDNMTAFNTAYREMLSAQKNYLRAKFQFESALSALQANTVEVAQANVTIRRRGGHRGTKPGQLRMAILQTLAEMPTDNTGVVKRVMKLVPTTTDKSIMECLYSLRRSRIIKGNCDRWMLISNG